MCFFAIVHYYHYCASFLLLSWNTWNGIYLVGGGGMDGKTLEGKEELMEGSMAYLGPGILLRRQCLGFDTNWRNACMGGRRRGGGIWSRTRARTRWEGKERGGKVKEYLMT